MHTPHAESRFGTAGRAVRAAQAGAAGVLLLLLAACSTPDGTKTDSGTNPTDTTEQHVTEQLIGSWISNEPGTPHLNFASDGSVTGSDGCNGISTRFNVDGDTARLDPSMGTLMACQGVDDWLRGVKEVRIDGDELRVFDGSGAEIGTLHRTTSMPETDEDAGTGAEPGTNPEPGTAPDADSPAS